MYEEKIPLDSVTCVKM